MYSMFKIWNIIYIIKVLVQLRAQELTCSYHQRSLGENVLQKLTTVIVNDWLQGNLHSWLLNTHCYDQFSLIYEGGDRTAIFNNTHQEPVLIEERARWTETYVRWSPQGTYLATFHSKGIALWGGEKFQQIMRFSHSGVQLIDFSPCER